MRIAFTHNLKTSDDEAQAEFDTVDTVLAISDALRRMGHEVHPVDVCGAVSSLVARLETLRPDLVFNTAEGTLGRYREAFYPALFEQLGLPYTGSGPHVCALTLDKQATKLILNQAGVPTPRWAFFDGERPMETAPELTFPVIVKPNFEGSSKGVTQSSIVYDEATLRSQVAESLERYPTGVLVEEFIVGRDVTVPYLEKHGVLEPAAYRLEVVGVDPGFEIYDYALKNHDSDKVHLEIPAPVDEHVREALQRHTATIMRELDVRDLGRADFRVTDDGKIYFIEVNALPSLEPGASIYESSSRIGLSTTEDVLGAVVQSAVQRQNIVPRRTAPGDGLRVGLAHNLRRIDPKGGDETDAEFDSVATIEAIANAIRSFGHTVVPIEATAELPRILGDLDIDLVFNIAEGIRGRSREAQIPALLDLLDIPFTGSDAAALSVTLDKGLAKRVVRAAGVATPAWQTLTRSQPALNASLRFPVIAKPNAEGSSKGVTSASVCHDAAEAKATIDGLLERYSSVLVEEFLTGREFTVGIVGDTSPRVLPIMEIVFDGSSSHPVYSFAHKTETEGGVTFEVPASVSPALEHTLREAALEAFHALGCRDVARIDLRLDGAGTPNFIECNPLPGLSPGFSDLCVIAETAGMDHTALVGAILAPAMRRLAHPESA